ncbi:MAG TPA: aldose 1-epimerase family protein [Thermomicrobiales bacterium]|jgi:galactose mutarotase-like enzyme
MMADETTQAFIPVLPTGVQYEIRHGEQRAVITEVGAALRAYEVGGRAFLDGFAADAIPTGGRGQVLIPWPNRIAGGSYEFGGARQQLAIGEVRTQNASHGLVRSANFSIIARDQSGVTLGLILHPQSGYPFALAIELNYRLDDAGLHVTTSVRNVGTTALPFGVGFHPYFAVGTPLIDDATFTLPAATALTTDERMIPTGRESVDGTPLDFRAPRPIGATILDTCYTDLDRDAEGVARIALAGPGGTPTLTLSLDRAFGFVQVYSGNNLPDPSTRRRGLAIEPMTCPANAFNSGEGLIVLQPGERFAATWSLAVTA